MNKVTKVLEFTTNISHSFNCVAFTSFAQVSFSRGRFTDPATQPSTSFETKMADPEVRISIGDSGANEDDVEMQGDNADVIEVGETGADGGQGAREEEGMTMEEEKPASRVTFVEYVSQRFSKRTFCETR